MTTVTWTQDSNSKYEVSSKEHLVQIMNNGALYTNEGSVPSNFMTADYVQTTNIDFENDSTNVLPIGTFTGGFDSTFTGSYDGNNFELKNYFYEDAEFDTSNSCTAFAGAVWIRLRFRNKKHETHRTVECQRS